MLKRFFSLLLVLLFIAGCKNGGSGNSMDAVSDEFSDTVAKTLKIVIDEALLFDKRFNVKQSVFFDDNVENFMGIPQDIVVRGDTIYAVDPAKAPGIYTYLKDGSQLFAYCSEGCGPEDVGSPFSIRVTDTEVAVYDMMGMCILILDKSGNFKRKIQLPVNALGGVLDDSGGCWVDYSNQEDGDVKLEWRADSVSTPVTVMKVPDHLKGLTMVQKQMFYELPDHTILYNPCLDPNVYALHDGKAYLRYRLDFDGLWPSEDIIQKEYGGTSFARKIRNFPVLGKEIYESSKWFAVGFENEGKGYLAFYDKSKEEMQAYLIDKEKYYGPMYLTDGELYMLRKDDGLDIISLE